MDFRVFSRNISENMHARCVREETKQALKGNLQADGVQSRQTLFVRYCLKTKKTPHKAVRRALCGVFLSLFSLLQRSHSVNVTVASTMVLSPLIRIWFRLLSFREPAA